MRDWSNLPIIDVLIQRLEYMEDFVSLCCVCKEWSKSMATIPSLPTRSSHTFLIRPQNYNGVSHLFSFSTRNWYGFKLPESNGKRFIGTSHGWVFITNIRLNSTTELDLLHPFSRRLISLPRLFLFKDLDNMIVSNKNMCAVKIAMSRNPLHPDCVVVISSPNYSPCGLAFAKLGDRVWTGTSKQQFYDDVVYYKGAFYAVAYDGTLFLCDISSNVEIATKAITAPIRLLDYFPRAQNYLVESLGGLLLVSRLRHQDICCEARNLCDTTGFMVHKLVEERAWKEVEDLEGRALFVGGNATVSMHCSEHVKGNCIYFTEDALPINWCCNSPSDPDSGVYNMTNKTLKPLCLSPSSAWTWYL